MPYLLRDIAVAAQDYELGAFVRDVEAGLGRDGLQPTDAMVLKELVSRLQLAESQLATVTTAPNIADSAALDAAGFVLACDVDECEVYHPCDELTGEDASSEDAHTTGCKYVESSRVAAHAVAQLSLQLVRMQAAHAEMLRRNALLRSRPDLPADRTGAGQRYEAKIRELTSKSKNCIFCNTPCDSVAELRAHSAKCHFHPLYQQAQQAQQAQHFNLPVPSVRPMDTDSLANLVCEHLPAGFHLDLEMEQGCGQVRLFDSDGDEIHQGNHDLSITEQVIEGLNEARDMAGQPPVLADVDPPQVDPTAVVNVEQLIDPRMIYLQNATFCVNGGVGFFAGGIIVRPVNGNGPCKTSVLLIHVTGGAGAVASLLDLCQSRWEGTLTITAADGRVLPPLQGCRCEEVSHQTLSADMAIVHTIKLMSPTIVTDADWLPCAWPV